MSRIMRRAINHTVPRSRSTQSGENTWYTDTDNIKWLRIENTSRYPVEYWPGCFINSDGKCWNYIGNGSYNIAYRCENTVYKIQRPRTGFAPDLPERSVRIWNEINNPDNDPALQAEIYDEGWTAPFISGSSPSAWEIAVTLIGIYQRTRRIVTDCFVFDNFIKTASGKIICVDIGGAVRFEAKLERSQISFDLWKYVGRTLNANYIEYQQYSKFVELIIIVQALCYVEFFDLELTDINLLKNNFELAKKLAVAYDTSNLSVSIDPCYLLSKEIILQRSRENNVNDPSRFCFDQKKYYRLARLFELGIDEERARIMARDPKFTPNQLYELEKRIQRKLPINAQLNILIKLDNDELLYGIIRELWKETKGLNFLCFCTIDPDAEATYRMIQKLYREHPASRQRTISVITCLHDFAMKKSNQSNPFAVALKNKFNLELIMEADFTHANVEPGETINPVSRAAAPHFS